MVGSYAGSSTYAGILNLVSSTATTMNNTGASLENVCTETRDTIRYHDGVNSLPALNDFIYTDEAVTNIFNGGDLYYRVSGTVNIKINTLGKVTVVGLCIF